MNKHYYVAILAGGLGTRFWPKSRAVLPKQFLDILNTGKSLIKATFDRYASFIPKENIYIITSEEYVDLVEEHLPNLPKENVLAEPSRKNTAPCVAFISFKLQQIDPEAVLIIAPSDHVVKDEETFKNISLKALDFAANNEAYVTLGIQPTYANTGYGYIQFDTQKEVAENIFKVKTFTEKPDKELAETFVASGEFLWNAGIFMWTVKEVLKGFEEYQPEMFEVFAVEKENFNTPEEKPALERVYSLCTNISIDFALMEKAQNVYVIPSTFGWSDLGTWNSAYDNLEKDYLENAVAGNNVFVVDATNSIISAPHEKLVVVQGIDNLIVVDTDDVLLICKKENEQQIKEYLAEVKRTKGDRFG